MMAGIDLVELKTLKDFYALMAASREVRRRAVADLVGGRPVDGDITASLSNLLASLEAVEEIDGRKRLSLGGGRTIGLDMSYEIDEARKDIFYLEEGEETFLEMLGDFHPGFDDHVDRGRELLRGVDLNCLVSDRDGTVNNYCARYLTSIQSVYNAVFLTRFARAHVRRPVILTSAPLDGLVRISVSPDGEFYYAASKGRECLDREGGVRRLAISPEKQEAMDGLNARLTELTGRPEYEKFTLIGSGLQFKFGQSTVARQDINGSIDKAESEGFLAVLESLTAELDPGARNFRIEDTGLDVEIILTVETEGEGLKDFDKGDGVKFLDSELGLSLADGASLICGDTASDVPMLETALGLSPDARAIFVTEKKELAERVTGLTDAALIVPEPDMLVAILGTL
ncbi:trehalose 6-phosphate synthase [Pseudodesulfovibrio thermohalotolerans]|uniref:trehalose 6-phosphate synthase n=1 Tax=Pseudodesulfovibrio thermohalotolerans TaxID=2880651 RepID=UPI0024426278|nr:trehalose 6-phosphate synthase [Pseudodesulfovibrio thermohalotolerans]WFS61938.1 trehalose 6-phosphate synthase [Pseudodesulfovibrio thermohalotolerans]